MSIKNNMLQVIYEKIADKSLTFWCNVMGYSNNWLYTKSMYTIWNNIGWYLDDNDWHHKYIIWNNVEWYFEKEITKEYIEFQVCESWWEATYEKFPKFYIEKVVWHPIMLNRIEWFFKKNNLGKEFEKFKSSLSIDDYIKIIDDMDIEKTKIVYDVIINNLE